MPIIHGPGSSRKIFASRVCTAGRAIPLQPRSSTRYLMVETATPSIAGCLDTKRMRPVGERAISQMVRMFSRLRQVNSGHIWKLTSRRPFPKSSPPGMRQIISRLPSASLGLASSLITSPDLGAPKERILAICKAGTRGQAILRELE